MKVLRTVLLVSLVWTFFMGEAVAGQDSNLLGASQAIKKEHQFLADQLVQQTGGKVRIKTQAKTGNVNYIGVDPANAIRQPSILSGKPTPEEAARGFLSVYGPLFGLKDQNQELRVMRTKTADRGRSSVRFQQIYSGIPIWGGESIVQVDSSNNIISAHGKILPGIDIDIAPAITSEMAEKTARDAFIKTYQGKYTFDVSSLQVSKPELSIYNPLLIGKGKDVSSLVWKMEVTPKEMLPIREIVLVDARSGNVVLHFNQIDAALNRLIYDHNNISGKSLPGLAGDLRRSEGQAVTNIEDVDNAYDFAGDTYNFYLNYHDRNSIDNAGMTLVSTTRYCPDAINCPYPNAFWYPTLNQMVYGEGFASADDVVAHEMTHGVTDYESNLVYLGQSGAINEAFSDIWGEFVDLTNGKGNDSSTVKWLLGEDIGAIRSMKNPPTYSNPDRMWSTFYYCGTCDNGGVHWNSGLGNKAAYLMTDGGAFNGITVTGLGITKVAKIFYEVQNVPLITTTGDYDDLANALHQACMNLVGTDGMTTLDCNQVANAINATEMNHQAPENLDQNPGFENGSDGSWIEYSDGDYVIITNDSYYRTDCGDWYAWLGGYDYAYDYIYQDMTIPSNATQAIFQFWYGVDTEEMESVAYDRLYVQVRRPSDNALLRTLLTLSNANAAPNWKQSARYDLLAYKGQTIRIMFHATNDYSLRTSFLLEDVVLKVGSKNTPAVTSFKINSGAASTAKGTVTLNNAATSSPTHYMASESSDFAGASWQTYSTAPSFTLSSGIGIKTVYFKVKNNFDESLVMNDTVEALKPAVTSFKINNDALTTANGVVTLNNVTTNSPTHYMASEDAGFAGATWQAYSAAPSFTLSAGAALKTVYFKLKNDFAESASVSDTISSLAPVVTSLKISAGALSTSNNAAVTLNNTATNLPTHYMASEASGFDGAIWQKYSTAPSFALSGGSGTKTVYFKVKNAFAESAFVIDNISALAPEVTSFKINAGAVSTANGVVTLNNVTKNSPTHYIVSEDPNFSGASWQVYSIAPKFTLSNSAGLKTVYFKVKNTFTESSRVSDDISAAGSAPVVSSFKINSGASGTAKQTVTLNNVATNLPMQYIASESGTFAGATWQTYSTAPSFILSSVSGTKTIYFKVQNIFGVSEVMNDTIEALPPAVTSFKINAGALSTANGMVTLNNIATNSPTHYIASEDSGFSGASWQTYSTAPKFPLSDAGGTKTVYFKVKNAFGESGDTSDTITASGLGPAVTSFKINAGAASTSKGAVTLNNATANVPTHYMASEDAGFTGATWQMYSTAPSFTLSSGIGTKTVYFKVKNIFGESVTWNDSISALATAVTSFKINSGGASTTNGVVTLNNVATNSPSHYLASEDSGFAGATWQTYSTAPKSTLSDGSGTKTVYFKVKNSFGESGAMTDTISVSGLPPSVASFKINGGASSTVNGTVALNNTATNCPTYYMASEDKDFTGASWQTYGTAPSFAVSSSIGTKTIYFKLKNGFGESSIVSDTINKI